MLKKIITAIFIITVFLSLSGQNEYILTPQEKAYIYHTIRKSPILEYNIGKYVVYSGEEIRLSNGEINYDSTEQVIINHPELLKIYVRDLSRVSKGILSELTNKVALWELNKALQSYRDKNLNKHGNLTDYENFEGLLLKYLPEKAMTIKNGKAEMNKRLETLSNPTLTFQDKTAQLNSFVNWTDEDKREILLAYNKAINEWVRHRSFQIYKKLGGKADIFINILTAAGDGSTTSGLFEEREKDERGRWNRGLPKAVGLFPYQPYISKNTGNRNKNEIKSMPYTSHQFESFTEGKETTIHLDVWGYNSEKQTTVVIQKSGKQYPLFGSKDSRFLSPDSTFGGGTTYYALIQKIQKEMDELELKISRRKGLDERIQQNEKLRDKRKMEYAYTENILNELGRNQFIGNTKKAKVDKKRSPDLKNPNAPIALKVEPNRKERVKQQEKLVYLNGEIERLENVIQELKNKRKNIISTQQELARQKQEMLDLIGTQWVRFTEKDGLYIFEDSARFDIMTQDFTFPVSKEKETIDIRLIAVPISHKNKQYDEVMMHISAIDTEPIYNAQIQFVFNDLFESNKFELNNKKIIKQKDSIAVTELFEALFDKKKEIEINIKGGGTGKWENNKVASDQNIEELQNYPGNSEAEINKSKQDTVFKRLRTTEVFIKIDRKISIQIESYTDAVRTDFKPENKKALKFMQDNNLTGNQMLSAYRSYYVIKSIQRELNILAGEYLSQEKTVVVLDKLNKAINKSKVKVGNAYLKLQAF